MNKWVGQRTIGFIGTGNMAQAIISALLETKTVSPQQIFASNRSDKKLARVAEQYGITSLGSNEEVVDKADVIVLAVKPQDLFSAIEPIAMSFGVHHMVASLVTGVPLSRLENILREVKMIARIMPNTPAKIRKAVVGYCISERAPNSDGWVQDLCRPLGLVLPVQEGEPFESLTVGCGSGTGFVFEMMDYWIEWLEGYGFDYPTAKSMTIQTFLGAAQLAESSPNHSIEELQNQVVSKKGVTFTGLESMRELEIERLLRYSFEKAILRDRELAATT
jgi:pyrroline-5-carboxylate reductase